MEQKWMFYEDYDCTPLGDKDVYLLQPALDHQEYELAVIFYKKAWRVVLSNSCWKKANLIGEFSDPEVAMVAAQIMEAANGSV